MNIISGFAVQKKFVAVHSVMNKATGALLFLLPLTIPVLLYRGGEVPEGLELYSFPASDWAVFTARGPMPDSLQTLNTTVWREWFPSEGRKYNANGNATLEVYSAGNPQSPDYECGIWVPIQSA